MAVTNAYLAHFPTTPPSPRALFEIYQAALEDSIASHTRRPFVFPQFVYSILLLYVYLCIPHATRPWLYHLRWAVLGVILWREVGPGGIIWNVTSLSLGTGFGVGMVSVWGCIWSVVWLVCADPQRDLKRVERRKKQIRRENGDVAQANGHTINGYSKGTPELRQRSEQNGHVGNGHLSNGHAENGHQEKSDSVKAGGEEQWEYYWQSYPTDDLLARLNWVGDLILNFRGPGWNWELPTSPGPPPHIKESLGDLVDAKSRAGISSSGIRRFSSRAELARHQIPRFIYGYLLLDFLKVLLMKDPYFIVGPNNYPLPLHLSWMHPIAVTFTRRMLCCLSVCTALECIFILAPLGFCLILGPKVLGLRGEAWMYPTTWGSLSIIYEKGLAGLWGGWWHQTFRKGFSAPTEFLIRKKIISPQSITTKFVGLFFAFLISGLLHAAGSVSQFPQTKPLELMFFFLLQGLGIILQTLFTSTFRSQIKAVPRSLRRTGNFIFAALWIYKTSDWLVDDFSRCIWLFEPVPFSLFRGLGFGYPGDGWIVRIDPYNLAFYKGEHWWESGISL